MLQASAKQADADTEFVNPTVAADSSTNGSVQRQVQALQGEVSLPVTRSFCLMRFVFGLLLTTLGMGIVLTVGLSLVYVQQFGTEKALPLVGLSVLSGIMLLGGGFGLMATAAAGTTSPSNILFDGEGLTDSGHECIPQFEEGMPVQ